MNPADKAKTINGLMVHLRDDCNIDINGSKEKLQLVQYGYYHGYKGYRFLKRTIQQQVEIKAFTFER